MDDTDTTITQTARYWSTWLGRELSDYDTSMMLALHATAKARGDAAHAGEVARWAARAGAVA